MDSISANLGPGSCVHHVWHGDSLTIVLYMKPPLLQLLSSLFTLMRECILTSHCSLERINFGATNLASTRQQHEILLV